MKTVIESVASWERGHSLRETIQNASLSTREQQFVSRAIRDRYEGKSSLGGERLISPKRPVSMFKKPKTTKQVHFPSQVRTKKEELSELIEFGNQDIENIYDVDFVAFRNDTKASSGTFQEIRQEVFDIFHNGHAGMSKEEYQTWLKTDAGKSEAKDLQHQVRRMIHANYLQGHGLQLPNDIDLDEVVGVRKYLQRIFDSYDLVDAVSAIQAALDEGVRGASNLVRTSEEIIYKERGIQSQDFLATIGQLRADELSDLRKFADKWAGPQSGEYLQLALQNLSPDLSKVEDLIIEALVHDRGFTPIKGALEHKTMRSMLRDLTKEGPRTQSAYIQAVNQALEEGKTDYHSLHAQTNRQILFELGMGVEQIIQLEKGELNCKDRAEKLQVFRDHMMVLPAELRTRTYVQLRRQGWNLNNFDKPLRQMLADRMTELIQGRSFMPNIDALISHMGTQQLANFVSDMERLPTDFRRELLSDLTGTKEEVVKQLKEHLTSTIEESFFVKVHRKEGAAPELVESYAPFVKDWTIQGLMSLYNALSRMAGNGELPGTLQDSTTYMYMEGYEDYNTLRVKPLPTKRPGDPSEHPRPGANAHEKGKTGFFGEALYDRYGNDLVVLFDRALFSPNTDGTEGVSVAEATLIHETTHAMQLGGTPGEPVNDRAWEERLKVAEWSLLSLWVEADGSLADGIDLDGTPNYKNPAVRVMGRDQVTTTYGATDTMEDTPEYAAMFYTDPELSMQIHSAKFLYFNSRMAEMRYSDEEILEIAKSVGISARKLSMTEKQLEKALERVPALLKAQDEAQAQDKAQGTSN